MKYNYWCILLKLNIYLERTILDIPAIDSYPHAVSSFSWKRIDNVILTRFSRQNLEQRSAYDDQDIILTCLHLNQTRKGSCLYASNSFYLACYLRQTWTWCNVTRTIPGNINIIIMKTLIIKTLWLGKSCSFSPSKFSSTLLLLNQCTKL